MIFDGTHKLIGKGAQADVFLYKGFVYKVYKPTYPAEWISFEKKQQHEVNKAGLCSVRYYDTDDDHIIKMDMIDGEMLETKINDCAPESLLKNSQLYRMAFLFFLQPLSLFTRLILLALKSLV